MPTIEDQIRQAAHALGFVRVGFSSAEPLREHERLFHAWLDAGHAAGMDYLERSRELRADPRVLLPEARTVIVVAASYARPDEPGVPPGHGKIARFAWGADYHPLFKSRLERLAEAVAAIAGHPICWRSAVDTLPVLERAFAEAAGLGFLGKNTLLISPGIGSYTLLGLLLVDLKLQPDQPLAGRCGSCTLCLEACPTGALVAPNVLDGGRCLSYLTIETTGPVPDELASRFDGWVFGCDVCQEVCPYNRPTPELKAQRPDPELAPQTPLASVSLDALRGLRRGEYRRLIKGRTLRRTAIATFRRNAEIVATHARRPLPRSEHDERA
ncbi:MAG: tRNA epoxyqueuosine(34) reductase QueG [Deltaproteobacteria bacterium]|nr:tRNA epoxyqueuosine(34) reductase QueG [Deltaproteobacteria bacterium]